MLRVNGFKTEDIRTNLEAHLEKHNLKKAKHDDATMQQLARCDLALRPALDHCKFFCDAGQLQQVLAQGGDMRSAAVFVVHNPAMEQYARSKGFHELFPQFLTCDQHIDRLGPPHLLATEPAAATLAQEDVAAPAALPAAPAQIKIPEKLPGFQQRSKLSIAQQITHWFEVACFDVTAGGPVAYSPIRLWTQERRKAAGMKGTEGTRMTKASKCYLYLHVYKRFEDLAAVTMGWDEMRKASEHPDAGITGTNCRGKTFWQWAADVAAERAGQ